MEFEAKVHRKMEFQTKVHRIRLYTSHIHCIAKVFEKFWKQKKPVRLTLTILGNLTFCQTKLCLHLTDSWEKQPCYINLEFSQNFLGASATRKLLSYCNRKCRSITLQMFSDTVQRAAFLSFLVVLLLLFVFVFVLAFVTVSCSCYLRISA